MKKDASQISWAAIALAIGSLYAVIILCMFPNFTIDDAYITYRYAENLATHGQLAWNVGEPPVEGYTGIFLPLVLAVVIKCGASPLITSKVIGIASFFLGGLLITRLLLLLGIRDRIRATVLILYFTAPFMYVHALSGMETMLFSTAILGCMLALFHCLIPSGYPVVRETALLLMLLLVSLTRPEGVALSGISVAAVVLTRRQEKNGAVLRFLLLFIGLYMVPALGYLVWKYSYYGELLPNTFYAKAYNDHIFNPDALVDICKATVMYVGPLVAVCIILLWRNRSKVWNAIKRRVKAPWSPLAVTLTVGWLFVAITLLQYMRSYLVMNFSFRFFLPFYPIVLMTIGQVFEAALARAEQESRASKQAFRVAGVAVVVQLLMYMLVLQHDMTYYRVYKQIIDHLSIPAADFLKQSIPPSEWLVVHSDAGAVPYYTKLKTVDFAGLNDKELAKRPRLSEKERVNYFYSFNPGAVLFTSLRWDDLEHDDEAKAIVDDPRFENYVLVRKFRGPGSVFKRRPYFFMKERTDEYYYFVFVRKDLLPREGRSEHRGDNNCAWPKFSRGLS